MFNINLRIALRNLLRHKSFSAINIIGLAIGMAACLLIVDYVTEEKSFDKFHTNLDQLYRIRNDHYGNEVLAYSGVKTYPAVGPELKMDYPEVADYTRIFNMGECILSYGDKEFKEENLVCTDPSFLRMFSFRVLEKQGDSVLAAPNMIVISKTMARKFFGSDSPLGKLITLKVEDLNLTLKVAAVLEDAPENSHLQYTALISYTTLHSIVQQEQAEKSWFWPAFTTYIRLKPGADPKRLEAKFPAFIMKHNGKQLTESHQKEIFMLQPMKDIYLKSEVTGEGDRSGNGMAVYALSIIAVFILVIAWVNYINLTTAKAINRAKEVGVRKVVGAARSQLIKQFLTESGMLNLFAIVLAIGICEISRPFFYDAIGKGYHTKVNLFGKSSFWLGLLMILTVGSFLSGLYPAFVLSSFNPVRALKNKLSARSGFSLRKVLVVFQFTASVALIAGTFIIFRQISYMRNVDLGVSMNNTLAIPVPIAREKDSIFNIRNTVFKNEILKLPMVNRVTITGSIPGKETGQSGGYIRRMEAAESDVHNFKTIMTDEDFFEVFRNNMIVGRNFSKTITSDKKAVIVNESASKLLGYESPQKAVGHKIYFFGAGPGTDNLYEIIGVIKDYHHRSLKSGFDPIIFGNNRNARYFAMSLRADKADRAGYAAQLKTLMGAIEKKWKELYAGNPFTYFFADESFNEQYVKDQQFGMVFGIFSCLAIFVASLGLLGLASFTIVQRTKEIGIRKVLGAGVANILVLLSKDFIRLVAMASVIAIPLTWYFMGEWLNGYAFRITLNWWLFIIPALVVMVIAILTVSYQTVKTALANPVNSLRSE